MTSSVEQFCDTLTERRLLSTAELTRMRTRWFKPNRADVNELDKFGHWLIVNSYLSDFSFRMLRAGKADLLRLNQYQLIDHLASGPFAGAYLAVDPLQRRVVLEVLSAEMAAKPEAIQAFHAAAEQARSVRSPNVNLTIDYGEAQGRHYLIREFDEGDTLAAVLARRGKLQPLTAARFFALALAGLQALHETQVPAGPLGPESLLLSIAGKAAGSKARTVKILNAGVPRWHFDPAALDAGVKGAHESGSLDGPASLPSAPAGPREDLYLLGITFYRSLTGQFPYSPDLAPGSVRVTPIRRLAPEVPELLAELVESMIDSDPNQRPRGAAQAAKSLRVLLASEEEVQHSQPEDQIVPHPASPSAATVTDETPGVSALVEAAVGEPQEQPEEQTREAGGPLSQQLQKLWEELRPAQRDWVFFSIGAAAVVLLVLLVNVLFANIGFVNGICLLAGGALSFFVERLLRWREE
ncbi:MAG: serine/threonine protein kinase [Gemmataceae bacterium]